MECRLCLKLQTIDAVKKYIDTVTKSSCDVNIVVGRFLLDGKSVMGLFSLDLLSPIEVVITSDLEENILSLKEKFKNFGFLK